jgi:hypothetical protein
LQATGSAHTPTLVMLRLTTLSYNERSP